MDKHGSANGDCEAFWKPYKISKGGEAPGYETEAGAGQKRAAKAHPGFQAVQASIATKTNPRTGKPYGKERAGAILAARTRGASAAAKKANPNLKKVRGA